MRLPGTQFQLLFLAALATSSCLAAEFAKRQDAVLNIPSTPIPQFFFQGQSPTQVDASNQANLLDMHNTLRDLYGGVPHLQWDAALANDAQAWADQCTVSHSPTYFGESLGTGAVDACWNAIAWPQLEEDLYDPSNPSDATWMAGHFTQMIWKNTQYLGCGIKDCGSAGTYLVCHYWPPGNNGPQATQNLSPKPADHGVWWRSGWYCR